MVQPAIMEENKTLSELKNTKGMVVGHDRIERFQASFRGEVIQPGDSGYETARKIWNASIDKRPGIIARCSGVADVVAAVNFARENELLVAVRGGGHNVSGRALCDDGIVIDLSGMKGIHVNAKSRVARAQGGATLGDLDRETHVFGLAVPAGIISKTGIAGLVLGGGVGWLVRKYVVRTNGCPSSAGSSLASTAHRSRSRAPGKGNRLGSLESHFECAMVKTCRPIRFRPMLCSQ